jgi:hypothetical protein
MYMRSSRGLIGSGSSVTLQSKNFNEKLDEHRRRYFGQERQRKEHKIWLNGKEFFLKL